MPEIRIPDPCDLSRLDFPFGRCPHIPEAHASSLAWAKDQEIITSDKALAVLDRWSVAGQIGLCHPYLNQQQLHTVSCWWITNYLYDDQYISMVDDPGTAALHTETMVGWVAGDFTGRPPHQLAAAIADVFQQLGTLMDPAWIQRHRTHTNWYYSAVPTVLAHRAHKLPRDAQDTLRLRQYEGAMHAYMDFAHIGLPRIPDWLIRADPILRVSAAAGRYALLVNDIFSVHKDGLHRELNVVHAHAQHHPLATALELTVNDCLAQVADLRRAERDLRDLADAIPLNHTDLHAVNAYLAAIDGFLGGVIECHRASGRYSTNPDDIASLNLKGAIDVPLTSPVKP